MCNMRRMKRVRRKAGPKESSQTKTAIKLWDEGDSVLQACFAANISPSTLYRALQRRKEKR